jgi:hypothetical protein
MTDPDDRSHSRDPERSAARPGRSRPLPGSSQARTRAGYQQDATSQRTSSSKPQQITCGSYSGYSEDITADNVSSPKPRTPGDYSEDTQIRS